MAQLPPLLFSGNANKALAESTAAALGSSLALARVGKFSDGEIMVDIEANVRGRNTFIIQPTCHPTNRSLMELLIIADALKRSAAARITAVVPYLGYSRQDKRARSSRVPISAKLVANLMETAGIEHVLAVDLHSDQLQGYFDLPVDNVWASGLMVQDIQDVVRSANISQSDVMVVSPDVGGVIRARAVANMIGTDLAIIDKRRPRANESVVMNLIGDVEGKHCFIVDDMIDTAGTLCKAAAALRERGAESVRAYATHAVFSGLANTNIADSELDEVVVTDSIPLRNGARNNSKIRQLSLCVLLAEAIRRIHNEESINNMFK
jgi:ribose-phosphate pyrophosphokinase